MVLIGSDRNEADFLEYHAGMPWTALPFPDRFEVGGLRCLRGAVAGCVFAGGSAACCLVLQS